MTAARARLRGIYALLAGALLLLVVPFYQGQFLSPAGYGAATDAIVHHSDFAPLVAWLAANLDLDRGLRLLQLLAYLLILPLPAALAWAFWDHETRARTAVVWCGRIGVLCVLVGGVVGIFTSGAAASAYSAATSASARTAAVSGFMTTYALETLLAQALGGFLIAIMVGLVSAQVVRERRLPPLIAYFGLLVAALAAGNAVLFAFGPLQAQNPVTPVAYAAFALWLIAVGFPLARLILEPVGEPDATAPDATATHPPQAVQTTQETPDARGAGA